MVITIIETQDIYYLKTIFHLKPENELGDDVVLVTLGSARPDRDEGEVGHHQNVWLERTLKKPMRIN